MGPPAARNGRGSLRYEKLPHGGMGAVRTDGVIGQTASGSMSRRLGEDPLQEREFMNKILVVNINWLGDAIFSTPVFKALKDDYPQAHVACLCVPRVKEVLEHCSYIDEIIIYDEKGSDRWVWNKIRLIARLRQKQFDAAFILHRSMTRALLTYLAGIPQRIGYSKTKALLTHAVDFSDGHHRSQTYWRVLEDYGIKVQDHTCRLDVDSQDEQSIAAKLRGHGLNAQPFVVVNAGGNWDLKRWPAAQFSTLIHHLVQDKKLAVVLPGSAQDKARVGQIAAQAGVPVIILAGETTLGETLALYRQARAVISGDTGPLHLANAVGAKVIGIFGPTRPEITAPRGLGDAVILFKEVGCNHAPCYHLACGNNVCMQAITVDHVLEAVQKLIG